MSDCKAFNIRGDKFCCTGWQLKKMLDGLNAKRLCQVYYPDTGREVVHYKMEVWMIPIIEAVLGKKVNWIH